MHTSRASPDTIAEKEMLFDGLKFQVWVDVTRKGDGLRRACAGALASLRIPLTLTLSNLSHPLADRAVPHEHNGILPERSNARCGVLLSPPLWERAPTQPHGQKIA